jgi:OmcA/MtrC family decaheme c-type cytochrome
MKIGFRISQVLIFSLLILSLAGLGFTDDSDIPQENSALFEKSFYLAAADAVWIRPGLTLTIVDVKIPSDRKPVVTFRITDSSNQPLDRAGIFTPGVVNTSWLLAYLPANANQYVSYATRTQTSPINGKSEKQANTDSGGSYTDLGDGNYRYTFGTVLPATFDTTATHTLGVYATRDLRTFDLSFYVDNKTKDFIPNGSQVTKIREVVVTKSCNACHDPLSAHGETGRRNVEICILCHTPQTVDPDTGNTTDMKVMTHKIHMGKDLPSVIAGKPYQIIGYGQSVADYSTVGFPMDIRNCSACHKDSKQANNWLLEPTRDTCGSCHDGINWASGEKHAGGPQLSDKYCAHCHWPSSENEYDATVGGAHVPEYKSRQMINPKMEIVSVTNTTAGQKPTVTFKITDKDGKAIAPGALTGTAGRLALTLAGPTSDYRWYIQEMADKAAFAGGVATYTFSAAIPATAKGTYAVEGEGWVNVTLNPGTTKKLDYRNAWPTQIKYFSVDGGKIVPRRTSVDQAKCNKCHDYLQLHGNNRNTTESCVVCHNPATTDAGRRTAATLPAESIHMSIMIHKIHTGEELASEYTVYGYGGSKNNFNEVRYPGDRRNCLTCHVGTAYTVPLPVGTTSATTPRSYWDPTQPTAAACLGCHDSVEAAAHALTNTVSFGEACAVCHKESSEFAVSKAHAR